MKKIFIILLAVSVCLNLIFTRWLYSVFIPIPEDVYPNIENEAVDINRDTIHIFFNIDDNYAKYLAVTLVSILANTKNPLSFHVVHTGISQNNKDKILQLKKYRDFDIEFVGFDSVKLADFQLSERAPHIKKEAFIRLFMPFMYKDLDKFLYLDADTVVVADIDELWHTDIEDYYLAAVRNSPYEIFPIPMPAETAYYNSGVLLVNAKKWRQDNIQDAIFDILNKHHNHLPWMDQDIINIAMEGKIKTLPSRYNMQINFNCNESEGRDCHNLYNDITIIHWSGHLKPWLMQAVNFGNLFWGYAKMTPFYEDIKHVRFMDLLKSFFRLNS